MTTAGDMIQNAMIEIGALASGETATANDLAFGLSKLNRLLSLWNLERRFVNYMRCERFPFAASQQSYSIGESTADFDTKRPNRLEPYCNLIMVGDSDIRVPLPVITVTDYSSVPIAEQTAEYPTEIYYQATYPNGTLWPVPYPTDITAELELFMWSYLASFATTAVTVTLAEGYEEALTLTLAEVLCPAFGKQPDSTLSNYARLARNTISTANISIPRQTSDYPGAAAGGGIVWDPAIRGWRM